MKRAASAALLATAVFLAALPAAAQEFGVYLGCKGKVESGGKTMPAEVDLALRRNSQLAMISSSDILPAGQKMRLEITPQFYTMVFNVPPRNAAFYDWWRGTLFVWNPNLSRLHTIRISVNRQSAALIGEMRDGTGAQVGRLNMRCEPRDNETVEEPKF